MTVLEHDELCRGCGHPMADHLGPTYFPPTPGICIVIGCTCAGPQPDDDPEDTS